MLLWKVSNYFVISHLLRNLIGFFEKVWKLCNTNLIGQSKVLPTTLPQKCFNDAFSILGGVEGGAHFFEAFSN